MSDVATLLEAVTEVRSGSGLSRARASMTALQTLMRMSPEDKRAVAVLVAERGAPHLVDRIESGTGQDLSKAQVETVLQMFQQLDQEDLDDLRDTVTDADRRGAALADVTRAAAATAATAAGLEELVPVATDLDDEVDLDEDDLHDVDDLEAYEAAEAAEAAAEAEVEELDDEQAELEAEAARALADQESELARLEAEREALVAEAREAQETPTPAASAPTPTPTTPDVSLFDRLDAEHAADEAAVAAESVREGVAAQARHDASAPQRAEADVATIRSALTAASSSATALGMFRARTADVTDPGGLLGLLQALPDGWARRRAAADLLARDLLHGEDAAAAVASVARAGDRRFLAGTVLAEGLATPAQLDGIVDPRTLTRLAARPTT